MHGRVTGLGALESLSLTGNGIVGAVAIVFIDGRVRAVASATSAAAVHATGEHHHIISKESLHLITSHACTTAKNVEEEYGAGSSRQQHVLVLVLRFTGSVRDERRGHGRFQRFR